MSVTKAHLTDRDQYFGQIERLVSSHTLHGSESLCRLLRYLAERSLDHPGVALKEYQIATEVFGRSSDFDPQLDSTVRVQAGRLRLKLAEYYASEGPEDPVLVELPKGTYLLSFHHRASPVPRLEERTLYEIPQTKGLERRVSSRWAAAVIALAILLVATVALMIGMVIGRAPADGTAAAANRAVPSPIRVFWNRFASGSDEPWVIFSNGAFVGRPETGMRYFSPARDSKDSILDHYTGVGEVLAIHELDGVFSRLDHRIRVKRGSLFSLDDAQNNDLIFVGSPAENLSLRELPSTQEFVFQRLKSGERKGDLAIMNVHPQAGEQKTFLGSSARPLVEDYALIGLIRGLNPARSVMILAGTTTIGTEAAVEYVCHQDTLEELLLRLSVSSSGELRPFEAVLRVKVTRGVPVEKEIVALRKTAP